MRLNVSRLLAVLGLADPVVADPISPEVEERGDSAVSSIGTMTVHGHAQVGGTCAVDGQPR